METNSFLRGMVPGRVRFLSFPASACCRIEVIPGQEIPPAAMEPGDESKPGQGKVRNSIRGPKPRRAQSGSYKTEVSPFSSLRGCTGCHREGIWAANSSPGLDLAHSPHQGYPKIFTETLKPSLGTGNYCDREYQNK